MSSPTESLTPQASFLERFLEDRSIKWMLGLGMLVLLGSSLKFVTAHWESYSPFWKYLVLIAYTAATYGLAEIGFHRLMLRRTGTGLLALALCLLPMTFLSLRWVAPTSSLTIGTALHDIGIAALFVINLGFTALASRRILQTLLRTVPQTYWIAYLVLCASGALVPALPSVPVFAAAVSLWAVMTVGIVKVNRHVFWLAEEERWPRIFSFYPTALLAAQFLTIFALNFAPALSVPWYGFALALAAIPVLLTTDAAARVYLQRTGAIVFPWPSHIMVPFVIGILTCLAGLALSLSDLPRPMALVPTAMLSAVCFARVARRTRHRAFSWAMLLCLLMAYQFTPVYFQSVARQFVQSSAELVREQRLPYAFYAITYAPFIVGLVLAGKRKSELFAAPCRQLAMGLATVMLVASWTDPKAVFVSGMVLVGLWGLMRFLHSRLASQWGLGVSWLSACCGLEVFLRDIVQWSLPADTFFFAVTFGAGVLELAHQWVTRRHGDDAGFSPYELLSVATAGILAMRWIEWYGWTISTWGTLALIPIVLLLAVHQRRRAYPVLGEVVLLLTGWAALRYGMALGLSVATLGLIAVIVLTTGWALSRAIAPETSSRTLQAFHAPLRRVTTGCLVLFQMTVIFGVPILPDHAFTAATGTMIALVTAWSFLSAGRTVPTTWVYAGCVSVLVIIGRGLFLTLDTETGWRSLPVAWVFITLLGEFVARRIAGQATDEVTVRVASHVDRFTRGCHLGLACGTLLLLAWPARLAAALAMISLARHATKARNTWITHAVVELSFLQVLVGLLSSVATADLLVQVPTGTWANVQIMGTLLAAVWWMVLETRAVRRLFPNTELLDSEIDLWKLVIGFSTLAIPFAHTFPLSGFEVLSLISLFVLLTLLHFRGALRHQDPGMVWLGLIIGAIGAGYLLYSGILPVFGVGNLGAGLVVAALLSAVAHRCPSSSKYAVFTKPFNTVGFVLPGVIAVVCVGRSLWGAPVAWVGLQSLIILSAAMCYLIRWLETGDRLGLIIATVIFNASQMLLWRELSWSDPQLYLMPLGLSLIGLAEALPRELQAEIKTALRYAGALVILVSPLFHILDGDWFPLLTLMAASLGVSVLSLGLKSRPLLYSGTAFLVADLTALVIRGSLERTDVLWIVGIALGSSVVALAAYCENHREIVLQRMRMLSATLQTWA